MKTAVDKVKKGKGRTVNTRFAALASHYLFDPDFRNVASGWEKGVVEKNVQDSRRRIWQDAAHECFGFFAELNVWLLAHCRALWQELRHPEFDDLTLAEMLEHEQPSLMPMVPTFDGYVETLGKVSSTALVILDRNRYSASCELVGQVVSLRLTPGTGRHRRPRHPGGQPPPVLRAQPDPLRLATLPAAAGAQAGRVAQWRPLRRHAGGPAATARSVAQQEGGDRVLVKVLAAVPAHWLEAVLAAVELVLESGNLSAEHIENVLNRLKHAPAPEAVEMTLRVDEAPVADTERYDSLRELDHA